MFESSAVPAAIDNLIAMCTTLAVPGGSLDGVVIYDGWFVAAPSDEKFLSIGVPTEPGGPGVDGTQDWISLPGREKDESFSIHCEIVTRSGGTDLKTERDRAYGILAGVERLLRPREPGSDTTLGDAVMWSQVTGRIVYTPIQAAEGAAVRIQFEIACRARLSGS